MDLSVRLCRDLALLFHAGPLRRFGFRNPSITRWQSRAAYVADRVSNVPAYRRLFSRHAAFQGKTVVDLGCDQGHILAGFLEQERFSAVGVELDAGKVAAGRVLYPEIRFVQSTPTTIPLKDSEADIVYTTDTIEHLSQASDILLEVHRILRPGGVFLVHFQPWYGPYGSHLEDIIPFPWPHLLFDMDTLLSAAALIYDSPDHSASWFTKDSKTGERRPNPYLDRAHWHKFLNRMTLSGFRRMVRRLPFEVTHFERIGFGGRTFRIGRAIRGLANVPGLDEMFTNNLFCVLRK